MSGLESTRILARTDWTAGLMTLTLNRSADFAPGQFFNLGTKHGEHLVRRSYSAASAPGAPLEFLLSRVNSGDLTPSLFSLGVGDEVWLDSTPLGFFTLAEVPETKRLWLVATGTGLGPYLSMLRAGALSSRFEQVNIVHGVRAADHLAHREELALAEAAPHIRYIPVLSGAHSATEANMNAPLSGRITAAWDNGELEARGGAFDHESHMLLCGNPQMIEDMSTRLKARGFEKHRRRAPGHFNFEKYW